MGILIVRPAFTRVLVEFATLAGVLLLMAAAGIVTMRTGLPPALGYLAAGVIVASFWPDWLPVDTVHIVAEIGVLALLFFIGLELDLKRLRRALGATATTVPFAIGVSMVVVAAAVRWLGWSFNEAVALGLAVAVSSTLFGERLTSPAYVARSTRERVIGVLVTEDVAAAGIIGLLVVMGGTGDGWLAPLAAIGRVVFFLVLLMAGALLLVPRILDEMARRHVPELLVLSSVALIGLAGYLGLLAGSPELGALAAGVAAAEAGSRYVVRNALSGIRDLAAAVFFLASGLAVNLFALVQVWHVILLVAALSFLGKVVVHVPASLAARLNLRGAMHTSLALGTIGEFSLILTAVAVQNGVAHPDMRTVVVGTMVVILPIAAILMPQAARAERVFWRSPAKFRRPLVWFGQSIRSKEGRRTASVWGANARLLAANMVLLAGWVALAIALRPAAERFFADAVLPATAIWFGVAAGVALPMLWGSYRSYRRLVWDVVGLREGEREGAGKVRARIVDAIVVMGITLILVLASLRYPQTVPVLAAGAALATIVAAVAWRQLTRFHSALEATVGRVLGHDPESAALLDQVIDRYPWGVKFAAVVVPPDSPVVGLTIVASRIASLSGAMVAVLQRGRREIVNPPPGELLRPGDTLVLLGDPHQLARAEALIVSHGEAIRMTAHSQAAEVEEMVIDEASPWAGARLADTRIREETGTLVIGVWAGDERHPVPYRPDVRLTAGDRLILLGTPLQLQRARIHAQGIPQASRREP